MKPQEAVPRGTTANRMAVRPVRIEDAEALARLSLQLGYPSSREEVERRLSALLNQPEHIVLVAETHNAQARRAGLQVVAWVHAFVERTVESDPTVEIGGLAVDEAWRGRGVGQLLMEHAEHCALCVMCPTITVRSNTVRRRAHAFYQRLGYTVVKSQRVFRKTIAP
jgi:GNAT superfamily N-acetyltransferase